MSSKCPDPVDCRASFHGNHADGQGYASLLLSRAGFRVVVLSIKRGGTLHSSFIQECEGGGGGGLKWLLQTLRGSFCWGFPSNVNDF